MTFKHIFERYIDLLQVNVYNNLQQKGQARWVLLYYISEDLSNNNFDFNFCMATYYNLTIGMESFQRLISDNKDFFTYNKGSSILGHLRTYAIERCFYNSAFTPTSNYNVNIGQLNDYKYNGLYMRTKDFVLTISKTHRGFILPQKAKYRERMSKNNSHIDRQMSLDTLTGKIVCDESKYAIITYGYHLDTLTHLNILAPSSDYRGIIYAKNLLKDVSYYKKAILSIVHEDDIEEQIVSLNKQLKSQLNKDGEVK